MASCKRHQVGPFAYLKDVLGQLPSHPEAIEALITAEADLIEVICELKLTVCVYG